MILQNGKRIDGCSDTVPIGTLQPFLGLVPPKGYLACQGQMVSKITYSELYEICGDTFGVSTETHFYLPDLRGKTLAGYDESDTTMNTIGKLLGQKTHTHTSAAHVHTTGNHTLTIDEIPAHEHQFKNGDYNPVSVLQPGGNNTWFGIQHLEGMSAVEFRISAEGSGGNGPHNHGNTGSTTPGPTGSNTNYQPTITVNWIVKAVMLIPNYIIVEDKLDSDSAVDALSARQGKILNEKFTDYATKSEIAQYLLLAGGQMEGPITFKSNQYLLDGKYGLDCSNSDIVNINSLYYMDPANGQDEGIHFARGEGVWDTLRGYNGVLYWNPNRPSGGTVNDYRVNTDYMPGDTYYVKNPQDDMIGSMGGAVSNSTTEIRFMLLLPRSLAKIKSVTVNTLKLNIRHVGGGYLGLTYAIAGGYDFLANYSVYTHIMGENMLSICIKNSDGWGCTNNTPLAIEPGTIKLTFN